MKSGGQLKLNKPLVSKTPLSRGTTSGLKRTQMKRSRKRKASDAPNRSAEWLDAVRAVPYCMRCATYCQVEAAHQNEGKGTGLKVPDCFTAALCRPCHVAIDNGKDMSLDQRRWEFERAMRATWVYLFTNQLIGAL